MTSISDQAIARAIVSEVHKRMMQDDPAATSIMAAAIRRYMDEQMNGMGDIEVNA